VRLTRVCGTYTPCKLTDAVSLSRSDSAEALAASSVKIAGRDVLATWKVLVALAGAPSLYTIYAVNAVVLAHKLALPPSYRWWAPFATFAGLPLIGVAALKFGEVGMDVYKCVTFALRSSLGGWSDVLSPRLCPQVAPPARPVARPGQGAAAHARAAHA